MKITLKILAVLVVMASWTACTKSHSTQEEVPVTVSLEMPDMQTKVISDGMKVNSVRCLVYRNGKLVKHSDVTKTIPMTGGKATYTTHLISGQTYDMLFWAEVSGNAFYDVDDETGTVTVDYSSPVCNDDSRDAFFKAEELTVGGNGNTVSVTLKRPFAQLNFGLSQSDKALSDAISPIVKSEVKVDQAYTVLDLFTGAVSSPVSVKFTASGLPSEQLSIANPDNASSTIVYDYLAMNYILVNQEVESVTSIILYDEAGEMVASRDFTMVPLKRNYRTNIVGDLISAPATVNIVVDPAFETPDIEF